MDPLHSPGRRREEQGSEWGSGAAEAAEAEARNTVSRFVARIVSRCSRLAEAKYILVDRDRLNANCKFACRERRRFVEMRGDDFPPNIVFCSLAPVYFLRPTVHTTAYY